MSTLHERIESAKAQIRGHKKHIPYIFPQWQRLQNAKSNLEKAKLEYQQAKAAWKALGAPNDRP